MEISQGTAYEKYKYLYPPRPEVKAPETSIQVFERMGMWAQPKLNGSCAVVSTDGTSVVVMNRHHEEFSKMILSDNDLKTLHRGKGWMVLVGEYMNKSQSDTTGKVFNGTFVVFDILVYNGIYMTGSTFQDRQALLDELYKLNTHDEWIDSIEGSNVCFRAKNFTTDITNKWGNIVKIGMYEGFVFKRPQAKLEAGYSEKNNTMWQAKVRKTTKNYQF